MCRGAPKEKNKICTIQDCGEQMWWIGIVLGKFNSTKIIYFNKAWSCVRLELAGEGNFFFFLQNRLNFADTMKI
jgi:hypothetical protein